MNDLNFDHILDKEIDERTRDDEESEELDWNDIDEEDYWFYKQKRRF
ncbi:MAG: hypothetical protein WC389_20235 [Lutibacter sp.]|jgi:hypothetical protein